MMPFQSVIAFLGIIPEFVILIVAFMYMSRTKRLDGKLIFVGSLINVLVRLTFLAVPLFGVLEFEQGSIETVQQFYSITGFISFIGSVIFAIGLVQLLQFGINLLTKR